MPEELEIRAVAGDDEVRQCVDLMVSSEPWMTLGRTPEQALKIMTSPTREVYVAMIDGEVVGFLVLVMKALFVGFVQSLAVSPGLRNRGIGADLMRFAERRIFEDSPNVYLCVSSFNEGAQRFYRRLGYEVVGELKELLIRGHSEILMRKTIGPISEFNRRKTSGAG
jgi:ribosomal-protein-alanine N-acetyltransferase